MTKHTPATAPLDELSAALDEIYALRILLAYEAGVIDAHLELKSFPKSRRAIAELQVERMRAAARGEALVKERTLTDQQARTALQDAGAKQTMTRHDWNTTRAQVLGG